jgi:hypothetical protein
MVGNHMAPAFKTRWLRYQEPTQSAAAIVLPFALRFGTHGRQGWWHREGMPHTTGAMQSLPSGAVLYESPYPPSTAISFLSFAKKKHTSYIPFRQTPSPVIPSTICDRHCP